MDRQSVDPADPEPVLNAVGVAFGQALRAQLPEFRWVRVTEDGEENLAMLGPPGQGDVLIYPEDLVAAQYEARGGTFLVDAVTQIVATSASSAPDAQVGHSRLRAGAPAAVPW